MDNFCLDSPGTSTLISVLLSQKYTLEELGVQRKKKISGGLNKHIQFRKWNIYFRRHQKKGYQERQHLLYHFWWVSEHS